MSAAKKTAAKAKKKGRVDVDRTRESLEHLGLEHAAERLGELLSEAVKGEVPAHRFLDRLLEAEIQQREEWRIATSLRLSGLPTGYTLSDFDWAFQLSIKKSLDQEEPDRDPGHLRLDQGAGDRPPPGTARRREDAPRGRSRRQGHRERLLGRLLPARGPAPCAQEGR